MFLKAVAAMDPLARGIEAAARGDLDSAIAACTDAIEANHPLLHLGYRHRGHTYLRKHEWEKAIADLSQAIELDSTAANPYANRGYAFMHIGDYARAIADCTEAIRLDPYLSGAYGYRAHSYLAMGEMGRAIADATRAIELGHESAAVLSACFSDRGRALWEMGEFDRAMADFAESIRVDPNNALASYYRGLAYEREGELRKAQEDFARAAMLGYEPGNRE